MNFKKTTLGVAVAATLGFAAGSQAGVFINNSNSAAPIKIAKERNLEANGTIVEGTTAGMFNAKFLTIPNYAINANNKLFVKVSLLGGAKFWKTPTLTCYGAGAISGAFQQGGAGATDVSFSLASGKTITGSTTSAAACVLDVSGYSVGAQTDVEVSALVRYQDGLTQKETAYKGKLFQFVTAAFATFGKGDAQVTADVRKSSKEFTTSTKPANSTIKTAYLGFVKYKASGALGITGGTVTAGHIIKSAKITIDGAALAAASNIYLQATASTVAAAACNTKGIQATPNNSTTITFSGIKATALSVGYAVCMEVDGTKSMEQGQITAAIEVINQTNWVGNSSPFGSNNLVNVVKNGTTIRVLNIPKPSGVEKAFIRFYNPTNQPVRISGTLYDQAGTQVATGELFASLPANDVEVLSSDTLAAKLGNVTWTGRAWLKVEADSSNFKVMATLRDGTGTLVNMSNAGRN